MNLDSFKISATPVTQAQYEAVMEVNPSEFKGKEHGDAADRPVENVSWNDAMVFCERLTKLAKGKYRVTLPTEAQWEYAARGGNKSQNYEFSGSKNLKEVGWYDKNSQNSTHPVAIKKPNELGLYDMSGNVWEWCSDWYGAKYYDDCKKKGMVENPRGPDDGSIRVLRGGSWFNSALTCRSGFRGGGVSSYLDLSIGFRIARPLP